MMFALPAILQQQQEVIDPTQPRYCPFHKTPVFPVYAIPANPALIDPYWVNNTIYLTGIGTNGSTNIVDSSITPKTVTVEGDELYYSNQQFKYNDSSIYIGGLSGAVDRLRFLNYSDSLSTFTYELWFYLNSTQTTNVNLGTMGSTFSISLTSGLSPPNTNRLNVQVLTINFTSRQVFLPIQKWYHLAVTRFGTTVTIFLNGFILGTMTVNGTNTVNLANNFVVGQGLRGYISNVRLTKGVVRYTAYFKPDIASLMVEPTGGTTTINYYSF